jgi:hypothetical protein
MCEVKKKRLALLIGIQIAVVLAMLLSNSIVYATNDDTTIASLIGGKIGGFTVYVINLHTILGAILSLLGKLIGVNVYTLYLLVVTVFSFITIDCVVSRTFDDKTIWGFSGICITFFFALSLLYFTFTVVAFFSGIAALLSVNEILFFSRNNNRKWWILAVINMFQALCIRAECIYALCIVEVIYVFFSFFCVGEKKKAAVTAVGIFLLLVIIVNVSIQSNYLLERLDNNQWIFRQWGEKRSEALDCAVVPYSDQLNANGISIDNYYAIYNAFYYDYKFVETAKMQALIDNNEISNKYSFNVTDYIKRYFSYLFFKDLFINIHRWVFLVLTSLLILLLKKDQVPIVFGIWAGVFTVNAIYYIIQRALYRVEFPVFAFGALLLIRLLQKDRINDKILSGNISIMKSALKLSNCLMVLCVLAFGWLCIMDIQSRKSDDSVYISGQPVLDYFEQNNDKLFLAGGYAGVFSLPVAESIWEYPGRDGQWNLLGNWEIYSTPYFNLMERYNIEDGRAVFRESIDNNSILYIYPFGSSFDTEDNYMVNLAREYYGLDVHFEIEDNISGDWYVYRLVSDYS